MWKLDISFLSLAFGDWFLRCVLYKFEFVIYLNVILNITICSMRSTGSFDLSNPRRDNSFTTIKTKDNVSCSEGPCKNDDLTEPAWKCRYVVTIIGFLIIVLVNTHRTLMSIAIVSMVNNTGVSRITKAVSDSCVELLPNSTEDTHGDGFKKTDGEFIWSPETQGYILGCFFFGQMLSLIPAGRFAEKYGCKWILVGALVTSSILTMLIPPLSWLGSSAVIVIQIIRGLALGLPMPCMTTLVTNWCPSTERGLTFSIIMSAHSLGLALGNIFVGYVSEIDGGWRYALYSIGGSGIVLAVYITFFIAESPNEHPRISKAELNFILSSQESVLSRKRPDLPCRQLLTSVPFYALIFAMFGRLWKYSQFLVVHSTFMGTILHFPIGQNGLLVAIPFLISFLTSILASWISGQMEKGKVASVDILRKFWNFISALLYSLCLLGIQIAGCKRNLSATFAILSLASCGLGTPGCVIVPQDMSPTFAGTLFSISTSIAWLSGVMLPVIVGFLTEEMQTLEQWNKVFFISIGVVMSTSIIFVIFGSAKIQPWNFVEEENLKTHETKSKNEKNVETSRF